MALFAVLPVSKGYLKAERIAGQSNYTMFKGIRGGILESSPPPSRAKTLGGQGGLATTVRRTPILGQRPLRQSWKNFSSGAVEDEVVQDFFHQQSLERAFASR